MARKAAFTAMTVVLVVLVLEGALRLMHMLDTYSEQTGGGYVSYYNQVQHTWYHSWQPNGDIVIDEPEVHTRYRANSLGVREREIPPQKPDSVKRLFFLGDSFTEGCGVDYPFSMPRAIEHKLDSAGMHFEVYDVGVSGSDPLYEYTQLRDQLLPLHPTHVIMTINGSDITDIIYRGGMERFHTDGTTHYASGPWWEPLYHYSRIARIVIALAGHDNEQTFLTDKQLQQKNVWAKQETFNSLLATKQLCDQHSIKLVVVGHPFPSSLASPPLQDSIQSMMRQFPVAQVNAVSTFEDFTKTINHDNWLDYSLKINGHFNQRGYQLFGDIVFNKINQQYPQFWQ